MTRVQRGRGGWVTNFRKLASASTIAAMIAMIAIAGCSSKKTTGINGQNPNGSNLGETTNNGSGSLEKFSNGTLGGGQNGPLSDIHFGYNEFTIEPQDGEVLKSNAQWLTAHGESRVQVEGHCDDRGSEDYNIALGAKRAEAAKQYLITLGISPGRISTISYGKELPLCTEQEESCWAQNRRDHFAVSQ
jgi:peptidoglycan-associated lipoprotein